MLGRGCLHGRDPGQARVSSTEVRHVQHGVRPDPAAGRPGVAATALSASSRGRRLAAAGRTEPAGAGRRLSAAAGRADPAGAGRRLSAAAGRAEPARGGLPATPIRRLPAAPPWWLSAASQLEPATRGLEPHATRPPPELRPPPPGLDD